MTATRPPTSQPAVLNARGISVRFGVVAALTAVDFDVRAGTIHALVGENGAGKSTLMRVLSGAVMPREGAVELDGAPASFASPRDARRAGVRMIHQELSLVPALSVGENIYLGAEPAAHGLLDRRRLRADARALLASLGEEIDPDLPVAELSLARREMVEIAKALAAPGHGLRILILDEPTAILSLRETETLFGRIRALRDAGVGVVYCSHRLEEIERLADEITVLRDGLRVAHGPVHTMPRDVIVAHMVDRAAGAGASMGPPRRRVAPDRTDATPALRVEGLEAPAVHEASFSVDAGEVVALVGLVGAGRTELARAIVGAGARLRGEVSVGGRRVELHSPRHAARVGIAYVSEDRRGAALIPEASVSFNMTLARLRSLARGSIVPVIDRSRERAVAAEWADSLRIKAKSLDQPVGRLSGGNQQKVVLARWLIPGATPLRVLIVDEPTRGVDALARADIHAILRDLAARGAGVLVITSDLEEAFAVADRLLVMREGRITGALPIADATPTAAARLMIPE